MGRRVTISVRTWTFTCAITPCLEVATLGGDSELEPRNGVTAPSSADGFFTTTECQIAHTTRSMRHSFRRMFDFLLDYQGLPPRYGLRIDAFKTSSLQKVKKSKYRPSSTQSTVQPILHIMLSRRLLSTAATSTTGSRKIVLVGAGFLGQHVHQTPISTFTDHIRILHRQSINSRPTQQSPPRLP